MLSRWPNSLSTAFLIFFQSFDDFKNFPFGTDNLVCLCPVSVLSLSLSRVVGQRQDRPLSLSQNFRTGQRQDRLKNAGTGKHWSAGMRLRIVSSIYSSIIPLYWIRSMVPIKGAIGPAKLCDMHRKGVPLSGPK